MLYPFFRKFYKNFIILKEEQMKEYMRAKKLTGRSGKILGSEYYFSSLSAYDVLRKINSGVASYEYRKFIMAANANLAYSIKEIYDDCKENARYFSFVSSRDREILISFIEGLEKFAEFANGRNSYCGDCVSYLNLSERESRRNSNVSNSDIDKVVSMIYIGRNTNLRSSERYEVIEKAAKSGVSWAVGRDANKEAFVKEVMLGHDEKFLKDVINKYDYEYDIRRRIDGRRCSDMFSERYVKYYEGKIFGASVYCRGNDYKEYYFGLLKSVCDEINRDFDNGARGTHFVKDENQKRIKKAAEELKHFGVDITYIELNLKRFAMIDVTVKLDMLFKEAIRDGRALKNKYPLAAANERELLAAVYEIISLDNRTKSTILTQTYFDTKGLFCEFIDLVESWAPYDIKRRFSWSQDLQYIFHGEVIDFDDTGNICFGVIAKAAGISEWIAQVGAGGYNFLEAAKGNGLKEAWKYEKEWWRTFFDDPRDNEAIKKGFEYYDILK